MERTLQRKISGFIANKVSNNNTVVDVSNNKIVSKQPFADIRTKIQRVSRPNATLMDDVKGQVELLSRIFFEKQKMNKELSDKIEQSQIQLEYAIKQTEVEAQKVQILSSRQGFISFKIENLNIDVSQFSIDVENFEARCNVFNQKYNSKLAQINELKEVKDMAIATNDLNKGIIIKIEKKIQQHLDVYNELNVTLQNTIEKKNITISNNDKVNTIINEKLDRQFHIEQELTINGQKLNEVKDSRDKAKLNFDFNKNKLKRLTDLQDTNKTNHDESIYTLGLLIDSAKTMAIDLEERSKDVSVQYQDKLVTQSKYIEKQSMLQESVISYENSNKILENQLRVSSQALTEALKIRDSMNIAVEDARKVLSLKIEEVGVSEARASTLEKELQDCYAQTTDKMNLLKSLRQIEPQLHATLSEEIAKVKLQEVSLNASIDELTSRVADSTEHLKKSAIISSALEAAIAVLNGDVIKMLDLNVKVENQILNASSDLTSTAKVKREWEGYQSALTTQYDLSRKLKQLHIDCGQLESKRISLEQDITNFSTMTQSQKNLPVDNKIVLPHEDMKLAQVEIDSFRDACNSELRAEIDSTRIVIKNIENRKSSPSYLLRERKGLKVIQDEVDEMIRSKQASFDASDKLYGAIKSSDTTPFKKPSKTTIVVKATSPDYLFDEYSK